LRECLDLRKKNRRITGMNSLTIKTEDKTLSYQSFLFPDGAVGVKLNHDDHNFRCLASKAYVSIIARIKSSEDVIELVMMTDALRRWLGEVPIYLTLPACPYQRQDRQCVGGEAFSLKVFANLINSLNYSKVTVFDAHSDVLGGVFDRVSLITQSEIIGKFDKLNAKINEDRPIFVSPDAGANKKTSELASLYGHQYFIRADKLRDLATGKIKESIVYADDLSGKELIIADDCCDGGASFIGLAKALKNKGASKIILYITHGIFSKGAEILFSGGIDEIYCTNSFQTQFDSRINVLDIEQVFSI
jgi:ribose-phosphate pyrophosphokinase